MHYHCESLRLNLIKTQPFRDFARRAKHEVEIVPATSSSVVVLLILDGHLLMAKEVPVTPENGSAESELFVDEQFAAWADRVREFVNETK